jgi:hypothetical protein
MKTTFLVLILVSEFGFMAQTKADTLITVTNGVGSYSANYLAFYDATGTHVVLDGVHGVVTITYPDQTVLSYPYRQTVSGLSVTGSWTGTDEWNYNYTATVQEQLVQTRHSGSGRGGGYRTIIVTSLLRGTITYDYAGAYAPPLLAPEVSWNSTQTSVTLSWNSASGGVPPYSYSVFDENSVNLGVTTELTAIITGLSPGTAYTFTVATTDSAGRQVSAPISVSTLGPTLNTVYAYDPISNSVTATWTADPYAPSPAVSYSVFYYDWYLGSWVDGADTTETTATVSGWSPNVYIPFYVAAYDANGIETDYDQQTVSVQAPPATPPQDEAE